MNQLTLTIASIFQLKKGLTVASEDRSAEFIQTKSYFEEDMLKIVRLSPAQQDKDKANKSKDEIVNFSKIRKEYYYYNFYKRAILKYKFLACLTFTVEAELKHNEEYRLKVTNNVIMFS